MHSNIYSALVVVSSKPVNAQPTSNEVKFTKINITFIRSIYKNLKNWPLIIKLSALFATIFFVDCRTYAQGFSTDSIHWALPIGGYYNNTGNLGYFSLHEGAGNVPHSQTWSTLDLNGMEKPN